MLFHRPTEYWIHQYPFMHLGLERGTVRVQVSLAQEHNAMTLFRAPTQTAWSRDHCAQTTSSLCHPKSGKTEFSFLCCRLAEVQTEKRKRLSLKVILILRNNFKVCGWNPSVWCVTIQMKAIEQFCHVVLFMHLFPISWQNLAASENERLILIHYAKYLTWTVLPRPISSPRIAPVFSK